jgi:HAD superfamily hydrolase (TIGR01490 family)
VSVAFFDFDKTLIRKNSGALWLKHEVAHGNVSTLEAVRATWWLLQYSLGFADLEAAVRSAIRSIAGDLEADMRRRVHAWYARDVRHLYRPRAKAQVAHHQAEGHKVVLLTSASNYVSEVVAEELGLDAYLCNRFEVDPVGAYTGEPLGTLCYGAGKLTLAQEYLQSVGVEAGACWFYTDSMADLAMMEAVGHPVAVNPDPRLSRVARARGWAVEDWGG